MEKLEIKNPHVIAHSFGGRVTIYLASKYKDLFNKIVLVDSAGIKPKPSIKKKLKIVNPRVPELCGIRGRVSVAIVSSCFGACYVVECVHDLT